MASSQVKNFEVCLFNRNLLENFLRKKMGKFYDWANIRPTRFMGWGRRRPRTCVPPRALSQTFQYILLSKQLFSQNWMCKKLIIFIYACVCICVYASVYLCT